MENKKHISIAIDGPAGAGKSTCAKRMAADYGIIYADTGAIYRTVGLAALRRGLDTHDAEAVGSMLGELNIELKYINGVQCMLLDGEDVSGEIRSPAVSAAASDVSALPVVRAFLLDMQRELARKNSVVMDGRDIGTVVLPDADLKIFITADERVRAVRRYEELRAKGENIDLEDVMRDMRRRDSQDSTRAISPLKAAEDAVVVDTSDCSLEESFELLHRLIHERLGL